MAKPIFVTHIKWSAGAIAVALLLLIAFASNRAGGIARESQENKKLTPEYSQLSGSKNTTYVTMCTPDEYSLQIIDESVTRQAEVSSVDAVSDPLFRSFITTVADHVFSKLEGEVPCSENSDGEPMIELVFVRLPLVTSGDEPVAPAPSWDAPQSDVACPVESPWLKLSISRSPSPQVRAVFIWNERQFLLDQVLLSGESPSLTAPPAPLTNRAFEEFARNYAASEIFQSPSEGHSQGGAAISERIPADVLWLFRRSGQSTFAPFSGFARSAMRNTLERAAAGYTKLVLALFDQCLTPDSAERRYESIVDVRDIVPLDEYRINQLH